MLSLNKEPARGSMLFREVRAQNPLIAIQPKLLVGIWALLIVVIHAAQPALNCPVQSVEFRKTHSNRHWCCKNDD